MGLETNSLEVLINYFKGYFPLGNEEGYSTSI